MSKIIYWNTDTIFQDRKTNEQLRVRHNSLSILKKDEFSLSSSNLSTVSKDILDLGNTNLVAHDHDSSNPASTDKYEVSDWRMK